MITIKITSRSHASEEQAVVQQLLCLLKCIPSKVCYAANSQSGWRTCVLWLFFYQGSFKYAVDSLRKPTAGAKWSTTHHVCQGNVQEHSSSNGEDDTGGKGAPDHDPQNQADVARHRRQQVEENGLWDAHASIQQDHEISCRGAKWQIQECILASYLMNKESSWQNDQFYFGFETRTSAELNKGCSCITLSAGGDKVHILMRGEWGLIWSKVKQIDSSNLIWLEIPPTHLKPLITWNSHALWTELRNKMRATHTELVGKLLTHDGDRSAEPRNYGHGEGGADGEAINEVMESVAQGHHPRHRLDVGHGGATQPVAGHPPWPLDVPEERKQKHKHHMLGDNIEIVNTVTVELRKGLNIWIVRQIHIESNMSRTMFKVHIKVQLFLMWNLRRGPHKASMRPSAGGTAEPQNILLSAKHGLLVLRPDDSGLQKDRNLRSSARISPLCHSSAACLFRKAEGSIR